MSERAPIEDSPVAKSTEELINALRSVPAPETLSTRELVRLQEVLGSFGSDVFDLAEVVYAEIALRREALNSSGIAEA